jgi:hypothetical protein
MSVVRLVVVDIGGRGSRGVEAVRVIRNRVCREALSYPTVRILPSKLVFRGLTFV